MRLYAPRAPDLDAMYRVYSPGLKIAQKVMRHCQSAAGSYDPRRIVLLPRQRINPLGNLYRCCELVVHKGVAPLTHQCYVQKHGTIKRMTPGLCALITNPRFRCSQILAWPSGTGPPA